MVISSMVINVISVLVLSVTVSLVIPPLIVSIVPQDSSILMVNVKVELVLAHLPTA